MTKQPLITLDNVSKVYYTERVETLALSNISMSVDEGEFVSIMGPSGCGKSTMLHLFGLLDRPTDGRVTFSGRDVTELGDRDLAPMRNRDLGSGSTSSFSTAWASVLSSTYTKSWGGGSWCWSSCSRGRSWSASASSRLLSNRWISSAPSPT